MPHSYTIHTRPNAINLPQISPATTRTGNTIWTKAEPNQHNNPSICCTDGQNHPTSATPILIAYTNPLIYTSVLPHFAFAVA